jgi:transcriptional regulator with XRE-family HTH domain
MEMRLARVRCGKRVKEIAIALGVSSTLISLLESGNKRWTYERIAKYKDALAEVVK